MEWSIGPFCSRVLCKNCLALPDENPEVCPTSWHRKSLASSLHPLFLYSYLSVLNCLFSLGVGKGGGIPFKMRYLGVIKRMIKNRWRKAASQKGGGFSFPVLVNVTPFSISLPIGDGSLRSKQSWTELMWWADQVVWLQEDTFFFQSLVPLKSQQSSGCPRIHIAEAFPLPEISCCSFCQNYTAWSLQVGFMHYNKHSSLLIFKGISWFLGFLPLSIILLKPNCSLHYPVFWTAWTHPLHWQTPRTCPLCSLCSFR